MATTAPEALLLLRGTAKCSNFVVPSHFRSHSGLCTCEVWCAGSSGSPPSNNSGNIPQTSRFLRTLLPYPHPPFQMGHIPLDLHLFLRTQKDLDFCRHTAPLEPHPSLLQLPSQAKVDRDLEDQGTDNILLRHKLESPFSLLTTRSIPAFCLERTHQIDIQRVNVWVREFPMSS